VIIATRSNLTQQAWSSRIGRYNKGISAFQRTFSRFSRKR